jgi:hypothetical protein
MSDAKPAMHSEDIELDEDGAESVIGGAARSNMTLEQALKAGYHEVFCGKDGTLLRNGHGKEIVVPYKNK